MDIAKRAAFIDLVLGADPDWSKVPDIDGILSAAMLFPHSYTAFCLAVALQDVGIVERRVAEIDRAEAQAVYGAGTWIDDGNGGGFWGFDIFNPALEDPRYYLFCADLLSDTFTPGHLSLTNGANYIGAVAAACEALNLPDVSAEAVRIKAHLEAVTAE